MFCGIKSYDKMFYVQSFGLDSGRQSFLLPVLVHFPVDNTLFGVSP